LLLSLNQTPTTHLSKSILQSVPNSLLVRNDKFIVV
jgi:hypothetical protein